MLRRRIVSQPRTPLRLNWSSPLLLGADFVLLGSQTFWNPLMRTITRVGTPAVQYTKEGRGNVWRQSANLAYPEPVATGGTIPWTIAGLFMPTAIPVVPVAIGVVGTCELPGSSTQDRALEYTQTTAAWQGYLHDGAVKRVTSTAIATINVLDRIVLTTNGATFVIAVKGYPEVATAVSTVGFNGYSSAEFCVGNSNGALNDGFAVPLLIRTRRYWGPPERATFLHNPWQIFDFGFDPVLFSTAAATGNPWHHYAQLRAA